MLGLNLPTILTNRFSFLFFAWLSPGPYLSASPQLFLCGVQLGRPGGGLLKEERYTGDVTGSSKGAIENPAYLL